MRYGAQRSLHESVSAGMGGQSHTLWFISYILLKTYLLHASSGLQAAATVESVTWENRLRRASYLVPYGIGVSANNKSAEDTEGRA